MNLLSEKNDKAVPGGAIKIEAETFVVQDIEGILETADNIISRKL